MHHTLLSNFCHAYLLNSSSFIFDDGFTLIYVGCELLYEGVSFGVDLDSRVAIVGPNGAGDCKLLHFLLLAL